MRFATRTIHQGQEPVPPHRSVMPPLYQSVTFQWEDLDSPPEFDYTRAGNPTRAALEEVLAGMENAEHGLSLATGMAAIVTACSLLKPGEHMVAPADLYGGAYRYFNVYLPENNISVDFVDCRDPENIASALRPETRMVWLETPTNPTLRIVDIAACTEIARKHGAISVMDNTFATPYFQNPLDLGCDISMHSTTKYINGHSDVVGGALMWNRDELTQPLTGYAKAAGNTPSPFDSWLTLRGLKTLAVRMEKHTENAQAVAEFLENHPNVERVNYPGLQSHPQRDLAQRQMRGFSGMLSCEIAGGAEAAKKVASSTRIFSLAESLGGVESLIGWPPVMSHAAMSEEDRAGRGIPQSLVRISVGIEDEEDLIADLDQALNA